MKFWPRSLSARLIIILVIGLIVAQAVSLVIHFQERGQMIHRIGGWHFAERIVDLTQRLDQAPADVRRQLARRHSFRPFRIEIVDRWQALPKNGSKHRGLERIIKNALRSRLPPHFEVQTRIGSPQKDRWNAERHEPPSLLTRVKLSDGSAVDYRFRLPKGAPGPAGSIFWPLAILLTSIVALVLFAVRQTTRPLTMLAAAATDFGDNIHGPAIPERGPTEVKTAARAFNGMQAKIRAYLQERSNLLAAVSHDLRTPITRLRIRTEMLEDETLRNKFESDLRDMEVMVNQALDYAQGLDRHEPVSDVDLTAMIESLVSDLDPRGDRVGLDLTDVAPYPGEPLALKRCFGNLVENALKYGTRADVRLRQDSEAVVIELLDDGPGIPETLQQRVLEPFFRVEPSRSRETGGSGMGLAIAHNVIRRHDGALTLENRPDGGLKVTVTLPVS